MCSRTAGWSVRRRNRPYENEDEVYTAGAGVGNKKWRSFRLTPKPAAKGGNWGIDVVESLPTKTPLAVKEWYNIRIEIK